MQAVVVNGTGPPEVLQLLPDYPKPKRGQKQVHLPEHTPLLLYQRILIECIPLAMPQPLAGSPDVQCNDMVGHPELSAQLCSPSADRLQANRA